MQVMDVFLIEKKDFGVLEQTFSDHSCNLLDKFNSQQGLDREDMCQHFLKYKTNKLIFYCRKILSFFFFFPL